MMHEGLRPLPDVDALPLIEEVDEALVALLRTLDPDDWCRVAVKAWTVKDVAAHLLDGNLRRLSMDRDGWVPSDRPVQDGYDRLVAFLDELNRRWIRAMDRISPRVLVQLLAASNQEIQSHFRAREPHEAAGFPVAWAGQDGSYAWMDIAREYTEKWHHQQQIREATGGPGLTAERLLQALLSTFARAWPRAYEAVSADAGTTILIAVTDVASCAWLLRREADGWRLYDGSCAGTPDAEIRTPAHVAWKLLTKAIDRTKARTSVVWSGPAALVDPFFKTIAIMG
jgi:uncharacterized protein (TIGR03083 family)